jgi:RNA polymerase sigma-70 factor (ECF subfamily)
MVMSRNASLADPVVARAPTESAHALVCASVVKYLPDLRTFARSLAGNRYQADDLVQGAILRAIDAAHQFSPGTNFRAWIFTILRNIFYNQWRSVESRHTSLDDDSIDHAPASAPSQDMSLEFCDFRRAFAQLVPEQREALLLIGAAGLEYAEVAAMCGCAVGTVKSRVSRARANLRDLMEGGSLVLRRSDVSSVARMDIAFEFGLSDAARSLPSHA